MNMHGVMVPRSEQLPVSWNEAALRKATDLYGRYRVFALVVLMPTLIVAAYYFLIASNQYESEAHFIVRSPTSQPMPGVGMSQALSAITGMSSAQSDAMSVADYLTSHDVVESLRKHAGLVARFQRPEIDLLSRLAGSNPTPERVVKYYQKRVSVKYNTETAITTLKVHAFTPQDSYDLAEMLLEMGEKQVNMLNNRSYNDSISEAKRQLAETERDLAAVQIRLTQFRENRRDIDPKASGQAQINIVTQITADLTASRAQLGAMSRMINRNSPQYLALAAHVSALEGQLAAQSGRLTGNDRAISHDIGGYEDLQMRQGFLMKSYEAAAAGLDRARDQAQRQQLYLVRVVEPNMPVKSLFPERGRIVLTVFCGLMLAYALGWLIVAGTREHAA